MANTTDTSLGTQVNNLASTIGFALANLQKYMNEYDTILQKQITTNLNTETAHWNEINTRFGKDTKFEQNGIDLSITFGKGEDAVTYDLIPRPKVVNLNSTDKPEQSLAVKENTIYEFTKQNGNLTELTLSNIKNTTLESRIYFICGSDNFKLNIKGSGASSILNEEDIDLEWDKGTQYCISILDGRIGVAPCYRIE